jgi:leucyl aminopeptidase
LFQISFAAKDIEFSDWHGDILAVAVTEKDVQPQVPDSTSFENAVLKKLDGQLGCLLRAAASEEEFTGKPGQSVVLRVQGQGFKRVALVGFVARSAGCLQGLGESVASLARAAQATSAAIFFAAPAVIRQELKLNAAAAIASGTVCSYYYISPAVLFLSGLV